MVRTRRFAPSVAFGLALYSLAAAGPARSESELIVTGFAGIMTSDVWEDAIQFWNADYLASGLVGIAVGQDLFQLGRLSFGYETQLVQHFGLQDNLEINLPLVLRYDRTGLRLPMIGSLAFGIGLSWASEKPEIEVDYNGDSAQTLIYWMGEIGFDLPSTELEGIVRIHHRSDGYGVMSYDAGSNALAVGIRRRF